MALFKTPKRYIIQGQKMPKCVSLRPLSTPKRPHKYQVPINSKKVQFLAPENVKICIFKAPFNFKLVSPISCAGKLQKGVFFGAKKRSKQLPKKIQKMYIILGQKKPSCVSLRLLLTPKRPSKYQVPKNSKKVQFLAQEKTKIWVFKAPFNSKKASSA